MVQKLTSVSSPDAIQSSRSFRAEAGKQLRGHFDGLIDQHLAEFYNSQIPIVLFSEQTQTLHVVEGLEPAENALMKLFFVAHARGQAQRGSFRQTGNNSTRGMILKRHEQLYESAPSRSLTVIPGDKGDDPYFKMLSLRRRPDGGDVSSHGMILPAEVLIGAVTLRDPEYSAMHPDQEVRELVKSAFLSKSYR